MPAMLKETQIDLGETTLFMLKSEFSPKPLSVKRRIGHIAIMIFAGSSISMEMISQSFYSKMIYSALS